MILSIVRLLLSLLLPPVHASFRTAVSHLLSIHRDLIRINGQMEQQHNHSVILLQEIIQLQLQIARDVLLQPVLLLTQQVFRSLFRDPFPVRQVHAEAVAAGLLAGDLDTRDAFNPADRLV